MNVRWLLLGGSVALSGLWSREARCEDLRATADRVAEAWHDGGGYIARDEPRFLYEGETVTVMVPAGPELQCETIALIGARGLSFHARVEDSGSPDSDERVTSVAGVLELTSCGVAPFRFVRVTSEAGRGALETVVARSSEALAPLRTVLLERTGGVLPPPAEPGALPPLPSPDKRALVAEARARREGATVSPRVEWVAGPDGKGEGRMVLEAGCHRIELFAPDVRDPRPAIPGHPPTPGRSRLDLDATLRDEDGAVLAHDHTTAADARIDVCLGEATTTTVLFEGGPPGAPVLRTHASLPIPPRLPLTWGRETRARMAAAMLPRHIGALDSDAVLLVQGASGLTPVPIEIEPGACYVAVAALERGHAHGLGLRATVGARESVDERGTNDDATVVAFCAGDHDRAHLEVEARSTGVSWGLALFRVAHGSWEGQR
jgi:hypothetical protein